MKNRIIVTRKFLDSVFRALQEIGFDCLSEYEQEICRAFDAGMLSIIENGDK